MKIPPPTNTLLLYWGMTTLVEPISSFFSEVYNYSFNFSEGIEYMKIIRDISPNHYMVLIKFENQVCSNDNCALLCMPSAGRTHSMPWLLTYMYVLLCL